LCEAWSEEDTKINHGEVVERAGENKFSETAVVRGVPLTRGRICGRRFWVKKKEEAGLGKKRNRRMEDHSTIGYGRKRGGLEKVGVGESGQKSGTAIATNWPH